MNKFLHNIFFPPLCKMEISCFIQKEIFRCRFKMQEMSQKIEEERCKSY
jgi:hypothetical protein